MSDEGDDHIERFEARYRAGQENRTRAVARRRISRPRQRDKLSDKAQQAIAAQRERVDSRVAANVATAHEEHPSETSHVGRRFAAATPRARVRGDRPRLLAGAAKGQLHFADSKHLALRERYIMLNPRMRAGFRIDLDRTFVTYEELLEALRAMAALPCLPHAVVYEPHPKGIVRHPHLWWLLPHGAEVWFEPEDSRCLPGPRHLLDLVVRRATAALAPLGADPSAIGTYLKGKNPLSPEWQTMLPNQSHFPDLRAWISVLNAHAPAGGNPPTHVDELGPEQQSEGLFAYLRNKAFRRLREWHDAKLDCYSVLLTNREALAGALFADLIEDLAEESDAFRKEREKSTALLSRITNFAAMNWDPSRLRQVNRGACAEQCAGMTLRERQAIGGRYGASERARKTVEHLLKAIEGLDVQGRALTKAAIAREAGVVEATVRKYWQELMERSDPLFDAYVRSKLPEVVRRNSLAVAMLRNFPRAEIVSVFGPSPC